MTKYYSLQVRVGKTGGKHKGRPVKQRTRTHTMHSEGSCRLRTSEMFSLNKLCTGNYANYLIINYFKTFTCYYYILCHHPTPTQIPVCMQSTTHSYCGYIHSANRIFKWEHNVFFSLTLNEILNVVQGTLNTVQQWHEGIPLDTKEAFFHRARAAEVRPGRLHL